MVVSDALAEVAVTTIMYVPAGVPVAGLNCCADVLAPPPHAVRPVLINKKSMASNWATMRRRPVAKQKPSVISHRTRATEKPKGLRGHTLRKNPWEVTYECGVVEMESVTAVDGVPDGSDAGLNVATVPAGKAELAKATDSPSVPLRGTSIRLNLAVAPAATVLLADGTVTL